MKRYSVYQHPDNLHFIIEAGGDIGFYLYVYEYPEAFEMDFNPAGMCRAHQQDYVQNTADAAQGFAFRKFGVPLDSWKKLE